MLAVLLGAVVSLGIAALAMSIILREFRSHGAQIVAALSFDERTSRGGDFRPTAELRQARLAPVRVRTQSMRRAAA